jgi:cytochrome o ubiquinol oxidase subunit I
MKRRSFWRGQSVTDADDLGSRSCGLERTCRPRPDARSLEWATASPPPAFNFAVVPDVTGGDAYWEMKRRARTEGTKEVDYQPIEMPRNSPTGFVCAFFATLVGFALIWHIWWMVIAGLIGAYATFVVFAWRDHDEYEIPAQEVARLDRATLPRAALSSLPRGVRDVDGSRGRRT